MVQKTFPHFGRSASSFNITKLIGSTATTLESGPACGEWVDVGTSTLGVGAQVPAFVETFPKAFAAKNERADH